MRTFKLLSILLLISNVMSLQSQDDCASSITIPFGGTLNTDNLGATTDHDYSSTTGCNSLSYASSHWYDITLPAGVSSIIITYTAGSIGPGSTITIVDECSTASSYSYIWSECNASDIDGVPITLCGLNPTSVYYIQVSSIVGDEGTFDINVVDNPSSPPNDVCATAIEIFGGVMECGEMEILPGPPASACPDIEATGNCVTNTDPGVWYRFDVPASYGYSGFTTNPLSSNFELFSSSGDCSTLNYEACGGFVLFTPTPNTTYFVLVESEVWIQPIQSVFNNTCNSPNGNLNTGDGMGGSQFGLLSCVGSAPIVPCQNQSVSWHSYTVGCVPADITISVDPWSSGSGGEAVNTGIAIFENDCTTLMAQYDLANGTGYVCSSIINSEEIILTNVPGGTEFVIAVGADSPNQGYYEVTVEESTNPNALANDLCDNPTPIIAGVNVDFNNDCANSDIPFPTCVSQSQATVWFSYDPGPFPQDVTFNIISNGINSPAIAAYDACLGAVEGESCSNSLFIPCLSVPIVIEIGSTNANTGEFDIEVLETPSTTPPPLTVTVTPICSEEMGTIELSFPPGVFGNILAQIDPATSTDITGMTNFSFPNVNSLVLDNQLINCGTATTDALYIVSTTVPGANCQASPIQVSQPVHPKLTSTPLLIEECLPYDLSVLATDIISGGTMPYSSYQWSWNGVIDLGTADQITGFGLFSSGTIFLTVVDANGCTIDGQIDVIAYDEISATLAADAPQACPGDPDIINLQLSLVGGGIISSSTWTILDESNATITNGFAVGSDGYAIETETLLPGNYYISANLQDQNGCSGLSPSIIITILPEANGEIILTPINACEFYLELVFYDSNGNDIFGNGIDSNGDGIPDAFDPDGDGVPNFNDITWTTPSLLAFPNEDIIFVPTEDGNYQVQITTSDGCVTIITSDIVEIPDPTPPSITGDTTACSGELIMLEASPQNYQSYEWLDPLGNLIGNMSNVSFVSTESGPYTLNVIDDFGCAKTASVNITISEIPTIQLSGSTTICAGASTIISTIKNSTWIYTWLDNMDLQLPSDSASITLDKEGSYTLIVSNIEGCNDTISFTITENENLDLNIASQNICDGASVTLNAGAGFDEYTWTNINSDIINMTSVLTTDTAGQFIITVQKGQCFGTDTVLVQAFETPTIDIIESVEICNAIGGNMQNNLNLTNYTGTSDVGIWSSLSPFIDITDPNNVDFGLVAEGSYTLFYTTTDAMAPCMNISDSLIVNVSNCECPNVSIQSPDRVCLSLLTYDLNGQLSMDTEPGMWSLISGPTALQIPLNGIINTDVLLSGSYVFEYQLSSIPYDHCEGKDTLEVIFTNPPMLEIQPTSTVCNSDSPTAPFTLDLNSLIIQGQGVWVDPIISGLDFSDPSSLDFSGIEPGDYTINLISTNAIAPCDEVMTSTLITVLNCDCPIIQLSNPPDLCNDAGTLNLINIQGISDQGTWSSSQDNPQPVTIDNGIIDFTNAESGVYLFIYTLDNPIVDCPEKDTVTQTIIAPPTITSSMDTEACNIDLGNQDNIINLTELIVGDPGLWTDDQGMVISDPEAFDCSNFAIGDVIILNYTTSSAVLPCQDVNTSISIQIQDCSCDDPVFLDPPELCNSQGQGVDLQDLILSDHTGNWQIISTPAGANANLMGTTFTSGNLPAGNYTIQFSLENIINPNCQQDWELVVTVEDQLTAELLPLLEICVTAESGDTTILDLNEAILDGLGNGFWVDESGNPLSSTTIDFLDYIPGEYTFTFVVENDEPCIDSNTPLIVEAKECLTEEVVDTSVYIPNAFSPNKDGSNDIIFPISNISNLPIDYFYIFDRWGEKIFTIEGILANDPNNGWNGTFDGKDVNPGVYIYILQVRLGSNNVKQFYGDITVIR